MATTSNFGWTTPDDTALVKDGASSIRSLGTAVDTTMQTMVPKSIVDVKGDLIAATAADTVSRLAVGANNTVLTADSAEATGLKWATVSAGGMTEITSGSFPTNSSTLTISSIPTTYKDLLLICTQITSSNGQGIKLRVNNLSAANTYISTGAANNQTTVQNLSNSFINLTAGWYTVQTSNNYFTVNAYITGYTRTNNIKIIKTVFGSTGSAVVSLDSHCTSTGAITSAITRLDISTDSANFSGGNYILYGVS